MSQNKPPEQGVSLAFTLLAIAAIFSVALIHAVGVQDDKHGEQVMHKECTVTHNSTNTVKGVVLYDLRTTCGNFTPTDGVDKELQVGETYDLTTSVGNWATTDPLVLSAEVSAK